jgi:hypothetical protein
MKGRELSFPFIYFSESGLFNELRPIQIKKFSSLFSCALSVGITGGQGSGDLRKASTDSVFRKLNVTWCVLPATCPFVAVPRQGAESVI